MAHKKSHTLDATVARIQARFGPGSLTRGRAPAILGSPTVAPHIPTGYPELDALLGIGGLPKGKVCEIVGRPTSGKTTLALKFLAQAQAHGPVAYLDQARYFDADYAHRCGLDLSRLLVGRPCEGWPCEGWPYDLTESLSAAEALVQSETLAALVVDAMDTLWLDAESSRLLGAFLNRLSAPLARSGLVLLILHDGAWGTPGATPRHARGTPLAHHAALRLGVRRKKWLQQHGDVRGCRVQVEVLKNRGPTAVGRPSGRSATISVEFGDTASQDGC